MIRVHLIETLSYDIWRRTDTLVFQGSFELCEVEHPIFIFVNSLETSVVTQQKAIFNMIEVIAIVLLINGSSSRDFDCRTTYFDQVTYRFRCSSISSSEHTAYMTFIWSPLMLSIVPTYTAVHRHEVRRQPAAFFKVALLACVTRKKFEFFGPKLLISRSWWIKSSRLYECPSDQARCQWRHEAGQQSRLTPVVCHIVQRWRLTLRRLYNAS